ncbi:protein mono-ADP-ribosyltransferase PARP14-like [Mercenaria mercenaria]|uniref:protein mono-ADP-ribosyltransferase PARP14-like n=1 Tax=Mercenaria mercenaria TaxID=6596 RepID=UPI00234F6AE8|nr:protein mono-ADP-ribosyltransferase PARP14-like [Mercenaria mercenaria]
MAENYLFLVDNFLDTSYGQTFSVLDFGKKILYREDKPDETVRLIRRELQDAYSFQPPTTWDKMQEHQNLLLVDLLPTSKEYQDLIERIQNRSLRVQYEVKKKQLEAQNPNAKNENFLWHGTSNEAIDSINSHGFNRSYCGKNATVYGQGVYFAVNASYSLQDRYSTLDFTAVKRVYYCRVLTGDYTEGKRDMKWLPPNKKFSSGSVLYNSAVDDIDDPTLYVVFNDTQAYPEYLVSFKEMQ